MKGLGNLPSEVDPHREFFRCNTLGLSQIGRGDRRLPGPIPRDLHPALRGGEKPNCSRCAMRVLARRRRTNRPMRVPPSGWCRPMRRRSASPATSSYRAKGRGLARTRTGSLRRGPAACGCFPRRRPDSIGAGRGLPLRLGPAGRHRCGSTITSDEQWLVWSEDLATTAAEMFTGNEFLKECPDEAKLIDLAGHRSGDAL